MQKAIDNGEFLEILDDSEDDGKISPAAVKREDNTNRATLNVVKKEMHFHQPFGVKAGQPETISLLGLSDDDSDYDDDDNIDYYIRCVVASSGSLGIRVQKDPKGFMISEIFNDSQLTGKVFLGDILKSIDGKRLSQLEFEQLTRDLQESTNKRKRRIYILRPKIVFEIMDDLQYLTLEHSSEGCAVSKIDYRSKLTGKIRIGDILTSIDGMRLGDLNTCGVSEIQHRKQQKMLRICVLRKKN